MFHLWCDLALATLLPIQLKMGMLLSEAFSGFNF